MNERTNQRPRQMVVVGGGLAGIAAAVALAERAFHVTLLESRLQLGGRATSYVDKGTGETIDNCQHVNMGCGTNLKHLCHRLNIGQLFQLTPQLNFIGSSGEVVPFRADPLPAPLHLARSFLRYPGLSWREKLLFARAVRQLARMPSSSLRGVCFLSWLNEHSQTPNLIQNVWEVILVSALSETLDRIDASYARKVFVDGFLANTDGWRVEIPTVSLDELYSHHTRDHLESLGVNVCCGVRAESLETVDDKLSAVRTGNGESFPADGVIVAVPHHQAISLLTPHAPLQALCDQLQRLQTAPITSVHLWLDRPLTELPHAVLLNRCSQWMFQRGESTRGTLQGHLYQVVISASRNLKGMSNEEVLQTVFSELQQAFDNQECQLLHGRVITERRAVFSAVPGVDEMRPSQITAIPNLFLAGDWTQTGWPATMEGAVRSGYLAAEAILKQMGESNPAILQPDLAVSPSARWCLGLRPES